MSVPSSNPSREDINLRILTIDDNASIHEDYRKVLLQREANTQLNAAESILFDITPEPNPNPLPEYQIDSAFQGEQGLELVKKSLANNTPYAVAFVDVRMPPGWDGIETVQRIWEVAPDLPVVLCTAHSDYSWDEIRTKLDRTDQLLILKKPFDPIELQQVAAAQVARSHLQMISQRTMDDLEAMVEVRTQEIAMTRDLVFFTLARLAESRDPETGEHLDRIQGYTRILGNTLSAKNLDGYQLDRRTIETIVRSSLLHDIGKVGIPDAVLLKPGRLTPDEFEIMKKHTEIGAEALEDASNKSECCEFLATAAEIARYHHERFDGTGYPEGLSGNSIPLSARIVAVADVFDALTSERVYKKAMPPKDARALIESESGIHFDPVIVSAFSESWDQFMELAIQSHGKAWQECQETESETVVSASPDTAADSGPVTFVGAPNSTGV